MTSNDLLFEFCRSTTNFYYGNSLNIEKIIAGGNEMRVSKKFGKYKIISFADNHLKRSVNMFFFKKRISKYKIIDEVKIFKLSYGKKKHYLVKII